VLLDIDGTSDFDGLHSYRDNDEVQPYAFDILALGGEDLRCLPLRVRKANMERLLARRPDGITVLAMERELNDFDAWVICRSNGVPADPQEALGSTERPSSCLAEEAEREGHGKRWSACFSETSLHPYLFFWEPWSLV
jgi:hypothetical protein